MNKKIFKYILEITDVQTLKLPVDSLILHIGNQCGELTLWALVDPEKPLWDRVIEIYGTGYNICCDLGVKRKYLGSAIIEPFVWHVFERIN